jgi:hypothetical protein
MKRMTSAEGGRWCGLAGAVWDCREELRRLYPVVEQAVRKSEEGECADPVLLERVRDFLVDQGSRLTRALKQPGGAR